MRAWRSLLPTIQLTDGGPSVAPELPDGVAGPPFGAVVGWSNSLPPRLRWPITAVTLRTSADQKTTGKASWQTKRNAHPVVVRGKISEVRTECFKSRFSKSGNWPMLIKAPTSAKVSPGPQGPHDPTVAIANPIAVTPTPASRENFIVRRILNGTYVVCEAQHLTEPTPAWFLFAIFMVRRLCTAPQPCPAGGSPF